MSNDPLALRLAIHMDELKHRFVRPTAIFDALIRWGECEIQLRGPAFRGEVEDVCTKWWISHTPAEIGTQRDAWWELRVAIGSLLHAAAEQHNRRQTIAP